MLRNKNLVPLSHQHQHALALCVRIERASPIAENDLTAWQIEIAELGRNEIAAHFSAEEQEVFPAARAYSVLLPLVGELIAEHRALQTSLARAGDGTMSSSDLSAFARELSMHIRKEERLLFEQMQALLNREQLDAIGKRVTEALKREPRACVIPSATTKLRRAKTQERKS